MDDPVDAVALLERARQREEDGDDDGAIADFEHAVTLAGEPAEPDRRRIEVRALIYRAHGERLRGEYTAARATLDRALVIAESTLGPEAQATAEVLNAQGVLGKFSGDFEGAETAYTRAARIVETRHDADHPDMAAIYH